MNLDDKTAELIGSIVALAALIVLVYVAPEYNTVVVPTLLAVVAALSAAEAGRRRGKRTPTTPDGADPRPRPDADTERESGRVGYDTNEEYQARARRRE